VKFSIIIPTLNEENIIQTSLLALQGLRNDCEIILVDGGSQDKTLELVANCADKVVSSKKGRAVQMNEGAHQASGDILIFLHCDTFLPINALPAIKNAINKQQHWGRFDVQFNSRHFIFKIIAQMMNWRSRWTGIATGDQVIFMTRPIFNAVGGFPEISLMEDVAICKLLKLVSPPACLPLKATSSSRRWEINGILRTIVLMWTLRLFYFLGKDPNKLAELYSRGLLWKH
jgi:rSAM/selenodomain-associated transferase 2